MGLFDSLFKAAKDAVSDAVAAPVKKAIDEAFASSPAPSAACAIIRPDGISGVLTNESGCSFELPVNLWSMGSGSLEVDFNYHVAFDEDDADELDKASISVQDDFVSSQKDMMKGFKRVPVNGHPVFFECVTYHTEDRQLSGMPIPIKGKEEKIYRFRKGTAEKDLALSIPNDCPADEAAYARKAFELIASTFTI